MRRRARVAALAAIVLLSAALAATAQTALAGDDQATPAPSAESRKAAGEAFAQGEDAFRARRYSEAGDAFERAYSFVPHPDALLNAARAWQKDGDLARAANLLDRYLKAAASDAPDRKAASADLAALAKKLGRFDVYAPGVDVITIDDHPIKTAGATTRVYVNPGTHIVRGQVGSATVQRTQGVDPGGIASVAITPEGSGSSANSSGGVATTAPTATPTAAPTSAPPPGSSSRPLPPVAAAIGAGVTAVLLGATIGSGVDTLNAKSDFDMSPTQTLLTDGRAKQSRTNILLGVTLGAAALTAVAAIWLVRWESPGASAKVGLDAGGVRAAGSF